MPLGRSSLLSKSAGVGGRVDGSFLAARLKFKQIWALHQPLAFCHRNRRNSGVCPRGVLVAKSLSGTYASCRRLTTLLRGQILTTLTVALFHFDLYAMCVCPSVLPDTRDP